MTTSFTRTTPYFEVFDMIASVAFYRDLGFEVVFASPEVETSEGRFSHFVRLRLGDVDLMLNTAYDSNERPPQRVPERWRGHQDVALYIDCDDVDGLYETLRERGVSLAPPVNARYGARFIAVTDPDGYGVTFQTPITTSS
jgi:uncharacterized glyoxalase superfamily protein PhnB